MCSDHINDLLETEQKFKDHYNINQTEGKICRLYGFDIYEYDGTPHYNATTKKKLAWGAATADTDMQASVAFYVGRMMKANGSVQFYYSEASKDPLYPPQPRELPQVGHLPASFRQELHGGHHQRESNQGVTDG